MALGNILITAVPTPSGIVSSKFRDGNDSGAGAPTTPEIGIPIAVDDDVIDIPLQTAATGGTAPLVYEMERSATSDITGFSVVASSATMFTGDGVHTQAGHTASTTYWYRLAVVDDDGRRSDYSTVRQIATPAAGGAAPGAPTLSSVVDSGGGTATLTFTAGTGTTTNYDILLGDGDGAGNPVGNGAIIAAGIASSPYVATGLPTTQIYFRVRGKNVNNAGAYSGRTFITLGTGEVSGVALSNFEGLTLGQIIYVADPNRWGAIGGSPGDSDGMTVDNAHNRAGSRSCRVRVTRSLAERAECRHASVNGVYSCPATHATVLGFSNVWVGVTDWWFGMSYYIPAGFQPLYFASNPANSTFIMVMQMHWTRDTADPAGGSGGVKNPWLSLSIKGTEDAARTAYWTVSMSKNATQPSVDGGTQGQSTDAGPVRTGWTDWVFRVRLNAGPTGYAYAWKADSATTMVADSPIAQRTGGVGYVHTDNPPYMKFGAYTGIWDNATNFLTVGSDYNQIDTYDIWLDEVRWLTANTSTVADGIAAVVPR